MKLVIPLLFFFTVLLSCKEKTNPDYTALETIANGQVHPGKKLMETNCYVCHSPTASHEDRSGPPMIAIKKHYINNETTKEDFINDIQAWVKDPNEDNARMFGAVSRFGVMPKTPFPEETIEQIADYMFDHVIEQPEWFQGHFNEEQGKGSGKGMQHRNRKGKGAQRHM